MLPIISIFSSTFPTFYLTVVVALPLAFVMFEIDKVQFGAPKRVWIFCALVFIGLAGFVGARVFYVLLNLNGSWSESLWSIFTQVGGRVFYGSLISGLIAVRCLTNGMGAGMAREFWHTCIKTCAILYCLFRVQCFLGGCCWGRPTTGPLGVVFLHEKSACELLGLPLHPVQLYEAIFGLVLFLIFQFLSKKPEKPLRLFIFLYAAGRFFLESFRGDPGRGEDWIFGLSTSQFISVVLLLLTVGVWKEFWEWMVFKVRSQYNVKGF